MSEVDNTFSWDDPAEVDNFFNDSPEALESKLETAAVIEEITKEEDTVERSDEEIADDIFADENEIAEEVIEDEDEGEQDTPETGKDKSKKTKVEESTTASALSLLKEKGILDFELEEGEELTEDLAEELLEEKFDEAIEGRIEELFTDLPDVVKQMIKFTKDGGDPLAFVNNLSKSVEGGLTSSLDLTKESNQELVMKTMLKKEGYDDEYIDTQIEFLKDSGKLELMSKKQFDVWNKKQTETNEQLVKAQEQKKKEERESVKIKKTQLAASLQTMTDVDGLKLNPKDKRELPSYMHDKTVELTNGSVISSFHKDVWEALSNETTALQLAKMLRERKQDGSFDFGKIEKNAETKVTRKMKDSVQRNKNITPQVSAAKISSQKSLADYF